MIDLWGKILFYLDTDKFWYQIFVSFLKTSSKHLNRISMATDTFSKYQDYTILNASFLLFLFVMLLVLYTMLI